MRSRIGKLLGLSPQFREGPYAGVLMGSFLPGWTIFIERPSRRGEIAQYVAPRALEGFWSRLARNNILPSSMPVVVNIIFSCSFAMLMATTAQANFMRPIYGIIEQESLFRVKSEPVLSRGSGDEERRTTYSSRLIERLRVWQKRTGVRIVDVPEPNAAKPRTQARSAVRSIITWILMVRSVNAKARDIIRQRRHESVIQVLRKHIDNRRVPSFQDLSTAGNGCSIDTGLKSIWRPSKEI